jgi:hypothetical protein
MPKNKPMRRFLPAIALCAVLQPALADSTAPVRPTGPAPAPVVMHAALTPAAAIEAGGAATNPTTPVVVASLKSDAGDSKPPQQDERRPTTVALLLAALVVMTGIALRRWGTGES